MVEVGSKVCTMCKEDKSLLEYHINRRHSTGRASRCKECSKEVSKRYYNSTGERRLVYEVDGVQYKECRDCNEHKTVENYYPQGKNSFVSRCKECYLRPLRKGTAIKVDLIITEDGEYKECTRCRQVRLLRDYPLCKKGVGGRRSVCTECSKKQWAEYRKNNRETVVERSRVWREENPEKQKQSQRNWYLRNRDKDKVHQNVRKARLAEVEDTLTTKQWEEVMRQFNNACALTGRKEGVTMDHFIPISKGGGTTLRNVYPLNSTLNNSKHNRNPFEWYEEYGSRHGVCKGKWDALIEYLSDSNNGMNSTEYAKYVHTFYEDGGEAYDEKSQVTVFME